MKDRETFKQNFVELLRLTKIKQKDLAKYIDVSYQTVSAWATGRGYPRPEAMERICRYFGIKKTVLTEENNPKATQEDQLLAMFCCLSDDGKAEALKRVHELTVIYPKRGSKNDG